jgi:hypothetical protein
MGIRKWRLPRLKAEMRDALELVLLPGLAAVLPWPLCFAVFKWVARSCDWLYRDACERSLEKALARGWAGDSAEWIARRRLVTLVDHADYYLSRTRSARWLDRYMDVRGAWPQPGKRAVLCTFHWGAGMWGLRQVRESGLQGHMLVAPLVPAHFAGHALTYHYIAARTREITRSLGHPTLDVGRSLRPALRALQHDQAVIAAIDVPADQVRGSQQIGFLGGNARVPRALLRLAFENQVPIWTFLTGINLQSGRRTLKIQPIPPSANLESLVALVFAQLEEAIQQSPESWHFWSEADRFFCDVAVRPGDASAGARS